MANSTLSDADEIAKKDELYSLKQQQKNRNLKRVERLAKAGSIAAKFAGQEELSEFLGEGAQSARENRNSDPEEGTGAGRKFAGNVTGNKASNLAQKGLGATAGQGAALGGAVSAALQGEGAKGIIKTGFAWWWLNIMFGLLVLEELTLVGILLAILSVAYLDFHYIMSKIKKGTGFFITLNWWQKPTLAFSNLLVLIIPMIFIAIFGAYAQGCGFTPVSFATKVNKIVNLGFVSDPCAINSNTTTTSKVTPPATGDLNIVLTSAYRPGLPSADSRGETIDISLRPKLPFGSTDPKIQELLQIIVDQGFVAPKGYVQNEYANPSPGATAGHIHVQFNLRPDGTTYCDGTRVSNPPTDLVSIPAYIPMEGVSRPQLRQCMLDKLEDIFNAAGIVAP